MEKKTHHLEGPMRKIDKKRRVFPSRELEVHIPPNGKFGKSS